MLCCVDFGACRDFPSSFVDPYLEMVVACARGDGGQVLLKSRELGFLTGDEARVMEEAHVAAASHTALAGLHGRLYRRE